MQYSVVLAGPERVVSVENAPARTSDRISVSKGEKVSADGSGGDKVPEPFTDVSACVTGSGGLYHNLLKFLCM